MDKMRPYENEGNSDIAINDQERDINDEQQESFQLYNEEMSRTAVGRLFDDESDSPESVSYVSGFNDRPPAKRNDYDTSDTVEKTSGGDTKIRPRVKISDTRPLRKRPPELEDGGDFDFFEAGYNDARSTPVEREDRDPRDRRPREHQRPTNPAPKPAVRVNVPRKRGEQDPRNRDHDPRTAPEPAEGGYDNFRQRYNPDEIISSPRNPDARRGRPGERAEYQESEPINPLRWILVAIGIGFLVLMAILVMRMTSLSGELSEAQETITALEAEAAAARELPSQLEIDAMQERLNDRTEEAARLRGILMQAGIDPDAPVIPQQNEDNDPDGTEAPSETPGTTATATFPREITVQPNDNLGRIASRYYGSNTQSIRNLIAEHNNLTDPSLITIGQTLTLPPLP